MCGIAGWVGSGASKLPAATCDAMLEAIAHRGPDDRGAFRGQYANGVQDVFLGHTRLAIIDPRGAVQPMCDSDAGLALAFNGEIYNFRELRQQLERAGFRFTLDSDTEVLLRAYQHWRGDVVHRLRGMFAFAVWDAREQSLFLARDRFGEKPLFLHEHGGTLYFASEIKALLQVPGIARSIDLDSVSQYLAYRYVPGPATLFAGIRKLPPATAAVWRQGKLIETRYWSPPDREQLSASSQPRPVDAIDGFRQRLEEAVRMQMVADVPVGAFLSGGIDSSVIVGLMSREHSGVKTFSVGFSEGAYSELPFAAEVSRHFGTEHHELVVSHRDLLDRLEPLVGMRDGPVSEPSDIALHLLAREAARSVKTVLSGEGSDEVLGGYPKHRAERIVGGFQRLPSWLRHGLVEPLVHALPYRYRRIKTAVTSLNLPSRERYVRWFGALSDGELARLTAFRGTRIESLDRPPYDVDPRASALRKILYFDQTSWLPDNLLERADRMTMAASIEARVPFLDHELATYVSTLPDSYRVRGFTGKWILREVAKRWLPPRILTRPKVGFRLPVNEWFRGPMREYLLDHLRSRSSLTREYYQARTLDALVDEHLDGRQNHEKLLWALLNLEIWHRCYRLTPERKRAPNLLRVA